LSRGSGTRIGREGARGGARQFVQDQFADQGGAPRVAQLVARLEGGDQLAQQAAHFHHAAGLAAERVARGVDAQGTEAGRFHHRDFVDDVRCDPDRALRRHDPATAFRAHAHQAVVRIGQLHPLVAVGPHRDVGGQVAGNQADRTLAGRARSRGRGKRGSRKRHGRFSTNLDRLS